MKRPERSIYTYTYIHLVYMFTMFIQPSLYGFYYLSYVVSGRGFGSVPSKNLVMSHFIFVKYILFVIIGCDFIDVI